MNGIDIDGVPYPQKPLNPNLSSLSVHARHIVRHFALHRSQEIRTLGSCTRRADIRDAPSICDFPYIGKGHYKKT